MKTDMLSWTKLNPTVSVIPVKKLFYNQFLYKAVIYCPAGRTIYQQNELELEEKLLIRIELNRKYNFGGSWYNHYDSDVIRKFSKLSQLKYFHNLRFNKDKQIKIRIEEPYISIYSNNEQELFDICQQESPDRLTKIYRPKTIEAEQSLLNNEIICSDLIDFNFKVYLKPYNFDSYESKKSFQHHLENIQSAYRLTKKVELFLESDKLFFPGGYFYCNDQDSLFFVKLAFPNLVSSIFKLTRLAS
jgi:hypothetical protein